MFAATTTDALIVADPGTLKKYPSSIPSCLDLIKAPTASSWSPDNTCLYISSSYIIHRYEPASNFLKDVYTHPSSISCLVARDRHKVIFASEDGVHTLECDPNPQITQTFDSHKGAITSLSFSNDNSLLSSTSAGAVHVHNLTLGSHVVMRGLPLQGIVTSVFHPHTRTRLLVAAGKQLMMCDTTRPSGPVKTISMNDSMSGDISAVACSPFSKTLVAVATSSGFVGLIDLEKEKALFRTLNLKTHLTTIGFSPEGAAIYFGTSTGKLLVLDLRALDKAPKSIALSSNDIRVETISVQKKAKPVEGAAKTPIGAAASAKKTPSEPVPPLRRATSTSGPTSKSSTKSLPSPARPRTINSVTPASPKTRRVPSTIKEIGINKTPLRGQSSKDPKKVLSPARDPLGNSNSGTIAGQLDELADRRRGKATTTTTPTKPPPKSPTIKLRSQTSPSRPDLISGVFSSKTEAENPRRTRTLPTSTSASALSSRKDSTNSIPTSTSENHRLDSRATARVSPARRQRTVSSASRAASEAVSTVSSTSRSTKSGTAPSSSTSASRPSSSISRPASSLTSRMSKDSSSPLRSKFDVRTNRAELRRTPSPDLPDVQVEPVTPVPAQKQKKKDMEVLGLGTPEVDRWIHAGKETERQRKVKDLTGKGKNVGFEDDFEKDTRGDDQNDNDNEDNDDNDDEQEMERTLSMQISPRRPTEASGSGSSNKWATSPPTPLAGTPPSLGGPGASAQELLKTIVQDVLYDFQQETRAEMMGLHLDLLRMGRGWKIELRTLMDEYVGDLRDLREENQRLRLENERLRRGY